MAKVYALILLVALAVYSFGLSISPVHLNQDEAMAALNAKSLSETGRDFYGNYLPFYFWHLDNFWQAPVLLYWTALFLKFLPFNEVSIRLPSVVMAVVNIGLMMYLTRSIFKKESLALISGALLAITPAFFVNARVLIDTFYPITFVLLWLIFLSKERMFLAGLFLGLGIHTYHAPKIYMPIYFLFSLLLAVLMKNRIKWGRYLLGFLIPVIVFIPWLIVHPGTLLSQVSYASSIDKNIGSNFLQNYLSYFDPGLLFITGDRTFIHSTGKAGVFLFPIVFLLVFGILRSTTSKDYFSKLALFGFLTYPIAPSLINDPGRISRALIVIPFGILLSMYGFEFLSKQKEKIFKHLLILILGLSLFQFIGFTADYFGQYRLRSRAVFNNNIGGAFESALRSTKIRPVKSIYIDKNIFQAKYYFEFYKKKLEIYPREVYFFDSNSEDFTQYPEGSIVVSNKKFANLGKYEVIEIIRELDGTETYFVYWRDQK